MRPDPGIGDALEPETFRGPGLAEIDRAHGAAQRCSSACGSADPIRRASSSTRARSSIADPTHLRDRLPTGIFDAPVLDLSARIVANGWVVAPHRDDDIRGSEHRGIDLLRDSSVQIEPHLAHRLDYHRMDRRRGARSSRKGLMSGRQALEERLRHLAPARVLAAEKQDVMGMTIPDRGGALRSRRSRATWPP